jgi:hypothetical protein
MDFCRIAEALYGALPLRFFRDWLIRAHMDRCPRCQARLLGREEAQGLFVTPDQIGDATDLWRRIAREAGRAAVARPRGGTMAWQWALGVSTVAVLALAGFWLLRETGHPGGELAAIPPADRFQVDYINVGGEPAQTFVYQPQGTDTVFVWAGRTP